MNLPIFGTFVYLLAVSALGILFWFLYSWGKKEKVPRRKTITVFMEWCRGKWIDYPPENYSDILVRISTGYYSRSDLAKMICPLLGLKNSKTPTDDEIYEAYGKLMYIFAGATISILASIAAIFKYLF
jgi:hypothetical protein